MAEETGVSKVPLVEPQVAAENGTAAATTPPVAPPVPPAPGGEFRTPPDDAGVAQAPSPPNPPPVMNYFGGGGVDNNDPNLLLQQQQQQQQEEEEERQVPPISHHFKSLKYWLWAFRYPLIFFLVNVIVIVALLVVMTFIQDSMYFAYYELDSAGIIIDSFDDEFAGAADDDAIFNSNNNSNGNAAMAQKVQKAFRSFTIVGSIYAVLFLVDAFVCYKGARFVEKKLRALELTGDGEDDLHMQQEEAASSISNGGNNTANTNPREVPFIPLSDREDGGMNTTEPPRRPVNYAELSREMDKFLGLPTSSSGTTFLISLLFALWALSLSGAEVAVATVLYAKLETNDTMTCLAPDTRFRGESVAVPLEKDPAFATLPSDVQTWLRNDENGMDWFDMNDSEKYYVELEDGSLFFLAGAEWSDRSIIQHTTKGEVIKHHDMIEPSNLVAIPSPSNKTVNSGFCGISQQSRVFCYDPTKGFRMEIDKESDNDTLNYFWATSLELYVGQDSVWVLAHIYEDYGSNLELFSIDVKTMQRTKVIGSRSSRKGMDSPFVDECQGLETLCQANLVVMLALAAIFLYYFQDIPSSSVPGSISIFLSLFLLNSYAGESFGLIGAFVLFCLLAGATKSLGLPSRFSSLLWRFASREMLGWAFYTLLICTFLGSFSYRIYWDDQDLFFGLSIASGLVGGLLLRHAIFEVLAVGFGVVAVASIVCLVIFPPVIVFLPLWIVLCLGCWSTGLIIRKYNLHVSVYCRRCWRCLWRCLCRCLCPCRRGGQQGGSYHHVAGTDDPSNIVIGVTPMGTPQ